MSSHPNKIISLVVAATLAFGSITSAFAGASDLPIAQPAPVALGAFQAYNHDTVQSFGTVAGNDLLMLSEAPTLSGTEADQTEGGLPLAIILALAGAASAMGFYLYGVLVQHKPFSAREFAQKGGCGAFIGLLGRFLAGRAAVLRIFGAGATGAGLAACYSH